VIAAGRGEVGLRAAIGRGVAVNAGDGVACGGKAAGQFQADAVGRAGDDHMGRGGRVRRGREVGLASTHCAEKEGWRHAGDGGGQTVGCAQGDLLFACGHGSEDRCGDGIRVGKARGVIMVSCDAALGVEIGARSAGAYDVDADGAMVGDQFAAQGAGEGFQRGFGGGVDGIVGGGDGGGYRADENERAPRGFDMRSKSMGERDGGPQVDGDLAVDVGLGLGGGVADVAGGGVEVDGVQRGDGVVGQPGRHLGGGVGRGQVDAAVGGGREEGRGQVV